MSKQKKIKIIMTGGGSGGHTFPLIAVAREVKKEAAQNNIDAKLTFMGPEDKSNEFLSGEGIKIKNITSGKLRRYFSSHTLVDFFKVIIGMMQSWVYLGIHLPDIIFSKGGYGSVPVVLIGRLFRIPVVLHESDIVPGMSNKLLARFSETVIVSFPKEYKEFPRDKVVHVGNPVRDVRGGNAQEARNELGITTNKPVILILGGSQGAEQINALILTALHKLTDLYEIIHQTGDKNYETVKAYAQKLPSQNASSYHIYPFLNEHQLKNAYAAAKAAVSRAGAGAIFELALTGTPSILLPIESSAQNHQQENALFYQEAGACIVLSGSNLTENFFLEDIHTILEDEERLQKMREAALAFSKPDAASQIAEMLLESTSKKKINKNKKTGEVNFTSSNSSTPNPPNKNA